MLITMNSYPWENFLRKQFLDSQAPPAVRPMSWYLITNMIENLSLSEKERNNRNQIHKYGQTTL